jgi:hypothetical protein
MGRQSVLGMASGAPDLKLRQATGEGKGRGRRSAERNPKRRRQVGTSPVNAEGRSLGGRLEVERQPRRHQRFLPPDLRRALNRKRGDLDGSCAAGHEYRSRFLLRRAAADQERRRRQLARRLAQLRPRRCQNRHRRRHLHRPFDRQRRDVDNADIPEHERCDGFGRRRASAVDDGSLPELICGLELRGVDL